MAAASAPRQQASSMALRRLRRDLEILLKSPNPQICVRPAEDNLLEWHFVLHSLPADTPYHGGCFHGKILFPPEFPHAPPAIVMVTPSGRLEVGKKLCLSMTDFHPESWNPAWSVETILVGLLSFFVSDAEEGYGAIKASEERRRKLAAEADAINSQDADFRALFPEMLSGQEVAAPSVIANASQVAPESSSTPEAAGQVVISETTGRDSESL
jgi:ubiquitin-protein ligase